MCGIAGIVVVKLRCSATLARSADAHGRRAAPIAARTSSGSYRDERAGSAHARLSIIDLATGQQPLADADGALWIVFNGEIFNYVELRDEADGSRPPVPDPQRHRGHRPRLRAWGEAAFERFNGQWAVALWDAVARRLVLARDRLGVRPLYFCEHGGRLYFASEVKAIFAADAGHPARLRSRRPRPDLHVLDDRAAAGRVSRASTSSAPGMSASIEAGGVRENALLEAPISHVVQSARRSVHRLARRCRGGGA